MRVGTVRLEFLIVEVTSFMDHLAQARVRDDSSACLAVY
jgi:hypothetical protein